MSELASFSESSRQSALQRFQLLRTHLEDGRSLAAIAREANIPYRTLQYWLERYRTSGLAALARKPRIDRGRRRKLSAALQEAIEGLALKKPPLSIRVVCNQAKLLADRLGEEAPTYDLVYNVVNRLPSARCDADEVPTKVPPSRRRAWRLQENRPDETELPEGS